MLTEEKIKKFLKYHIYEDCETKGKRNVWYVRGWDDAFKKIREKFEIFAKENEGVENVK